MRIISVWNEKGGVGKSATSYILASGLAEAGLSVLLLDADRQGSCSRHYRRAMESGIEHPFRVVTPDDEPELPDILVVDVKGGDSTWLKKAQVVIQPTDADRTSIEITKEFRHVLPASAHRVDVLFYDRSKPDQRQIALENQHDFLIFPRRSIVPRLLDHGATPFRHTLKKNQQSGLSEARAEFIQLIKAVQK